MNASKPAQNTCPWRHAVLARTELAVLREDADRPPEMFARSPHEVTLAGCEVNLKP